MERLTSELRFEILLNEMTIDEEKTAKEKYFSKLDKYGTIFS